MFHLASLPQTYSQNQTTSLSKDHLSEQYNSNDLLEFMTDGSSAPVPMPKAPKIRPLKRPSLAPPPFELPSPIKANEPQDHIFNLESHARGSFSTDDTLTDESKSHPSSLLPKCQRSIFNEDMLEVQSPSISNFTSKENYCPQNDSSIQEMMTKIIQITRMSQKAHSPLNNIDSQFSLDDEDNMIDILSNSPMYDQDNEDQIGSARLSRHSKDIYKNKNLSKSANCFTSLRSKEKERRKRIPMHHIQSQDNLRLLNLVPCSGFKNFNMSNFGLQMYSILNYLEVKNEA